MTTLPTWAVYAVSFGTPIFTFLGVLLAQAITRKRDHELEMRSRREETLRNLRWAAELAVHDDARMAGLGVAELSALLKSDILEDPEKVFVEAALDVVYEEPEAELDQLGPDSRAIEDDTLGPTGVVARRTSDYGDGQDPEEDEDHG